MGSQAKNWCFTINNPEDELDHLAGVGNIGYGVWQLEIGANGTPHYQGYLQLNTKVRLSVVKQYLGCNHAHLEIARGTPQQNRAYCTKEETRIGEFYEIGLFSEVGQGARSDLADLHSALKDGLGQAEYADLYFDEWCKWPNLVTNYIIAQSKDRDSSVPTRCILVYGPPGTGKSTFARVLARQLAAQEEEEAPGGLARRKHAVFRKQPGKWWDGYAGESTVIFDDFRGSSMCFTDFKLTIDRYPLRVEVKGSYCNLEATNFVITSNYKPGEWWSQEVTAGQEAAIFRRITEVYHFEELGAYYHYDSYASWAHDFNHARQENDLFVIAKERQTFVLEEEI